MEIIAALKFFTVEQGKFCKLLTLWPEIPQYERRCVLRRLLVPCVRVCWRRLPEVLITGSAADWVAVLPSF